MKYLRSIMTMALCMLLLVTNVAQAAMPCCCLSSDMQRMDAQGDAMPCHTDEGEQDLSSEQTDVDISQCHHCDCHHMSHAACLPSDISVLDNRVQTPLLISSLGHITSSHLSIFQPPKA